MNPTNHDKIPDTVFAGETLKFKDYKRTIELYLQSHVLLGYVRLRRYDGTQTFTFDGTVIPPIYKPDTPTVPPSTTGTEVGDEEDESGEDGKKKKRRKQAKKKDLTVDTSVATDWAVPRSLKAAADVGKVNYVLHQTLSSGLRPLIENKTPFDAWDTLTKKYGRDKPTNDLDVYREYQECRLNVGDDPTLFIARFDAMMDRYERVSGSSMSDLHKALELRHRLPPEWDTTVAPWFGRDDVVQYSELKALVEKQKGAEINQKKKEKALAAVVDRTTIPQKASDPRTPHGCFECHEQGHFLVDCPKLSEEERQSKREYSAKKKLQAMMKGTAQPGSSTKKSPSVHAELTRIISDAVSIQVKQLLPEIRRQLISEFDRASSRNARDDAQSSRDEQPRRHQHERESPPRYERGRSERRTSRSAARERSRSPRQQNRSRSRSRSPRGQQHRERFERGRSPRRSYSPTRRSQLRQSRKSFSPPAPTTTVRTWSLDRSGPRARVTTVSIITVLSRLKKKYTVTNQ